MSNFDIESLIQTVNTADKERAALLCRAIDTLSRTVLSIPEEKVHQLITMADLPMVTDLLIDKLQATPIPCDRRSRMRIKGIERFHDLVKQRGGTYSVEDAVKASGMTEEGLRRAAANDRKQVLSFKTNGQTVYPTCQFNNSGLIQGIGKVRKALDSSISDMEFIRFMLSPIDSSENRTPLDLLSDGTPIDMVKSIARQYLQQGN